MFTAKQWRRLERLAARPSCWHGTGARAIVASRRHRLQRITADLRRMGYNRIAGELEGELVAYRGSNVGGELVG